MNNNRNEITFKNKELNETYNKTKDNLLSIGNRFDMISNDIRKFEKFLIELNLNVDFEKEYFIDSIPYILFYNSFNKRLYCCFDNLEKPLIEHKITIREIMYPYLSDFLIFISSYYE